MFTSRQLVSGKRAASNSILGAAVGRPWSVPSQSIAEPTSQSSSIGATIAAL